MNKKLTILPLLLTCSLFAFSQNVINIANSDLSVSSYSDKQVVISGKASLHLTATTKTLNNTTVDLTSDDAWLFFDNVSPRVVIDSLLKFVTVNGSAAVLKTNTRVSIYKHGTVVIPHSSTYKPLKVYKGQSFTGDSASYSMFTFNSALGSFDNKVRSFKLKRGYMATVATLADGMGYSRVFIADDKDLEISILPNLLDNAISSIRVFDWEWVTKKGWCGYNPTDLGFVKPTWRYDWSAGGATTSTVEYVPIRQNGGWPGWSEISGKQYVSHVLGFNEPDHTEQSNLTVSQALAQWPDMIKTGLRIGSPACTNFSWLYSFMDSCKAKNYRVDYVAVHAYWNSKSPQSWYNDLKYIHDRTGRPIWITEWNNGANWTNEYWPDNTRPLLLTTNNAAKQLADLKGILQVLDTASFIERYSIYNWVEDARAMVIGGVVTPAGKYYGDNKSQMAFNRKMEVIPTYTFSTPSLSIAFATNKLTLSISDPNGDYFTGFILERKLNNGSFSEYYRSENNSTKTYGDTLDYNLAPRVRYRIRAIFNNGTYSAYTNEVGYDISNNSDIQFGNVSVSNIGLNPVLFGKPYTAAPTIITGSPTNNNASVLVSVRPKLVSYASRFTVQLAPWSYQNVSTLTKEDAIPYLVLAPGAYDFGGLTALANRTSVASTWTTVTFATAFATPPVVFVSQIYSGLAFATCVRVRNITTTGFEAKIQKETAVKTILPTETVSYFAITQGKGSINGNKIVVGRTADSYVGSTYKTITYGDSIETPIFFSQMQTCADDTVTATLRCVGISNKFANVIKQREKSTGVVSTLPDAVGWMVINPVSSFTAVNSPTAASFKLYPNPVTDYIYFGNEQPVNELISIYNMYGVLVKRSLFEDSRIDVRDLPSGSYILKTSRLGASKFVKM